MDKKKQIPPPPPPPTEPKYELKKNISDFDMMVDLDKEFWYMANKCVRMLADENRMELASDVKTLVKVLETLQNQYAEIVNENYELLPRVAEADEKLHLTLKMTVDSQEAMNSMKLTLENTWKELDASRNRELDLQSQLSKLFLKCEAFTDKEQVEEVEDDTELGKLAKYKHIILKERDRLHNENIELQRRLKTDRTYREQVDKRCEDAEERVEKIQKLLDVTLTEKMNSQKALKRTREDFEESKEINNNLMLKCGELENKIQENSATIKKLTKDLEMKRVEFDNFKKDNDSLTKEIFRTKNQLTSITKDKNLLQQQLKDLKADLKEKTAEVSYKSTKLKKCEDDYNNMILLISKKDKTIANLKDDSLKLKHVNHNLDKKLLEFSGKYENLNRLKESVTQERDSLRSDLLKVNNAIGTLKLQDKLKDNVIDNLKLNIEKLKLEIQDAKKSISQVIKEKQEQVQEMIVLENKIENLKDQLQSKIDQLFVLNVEIDQKRAEYGKIQKQLETINSERIMLQNSLQSCSEEKTNLKSLLSKSKYQITQLDEEISLKQVNINALNYQIEKLRSENQETERELRIANKMLQSTRIELKEIKERNNSLSNIIEEDQKKFRKLSIDLQEAQKVKNLIGEQMVSRNDEIILLKDNLEVYKGALDHGKMLYSQRIEDIRLLKLEVSNIQSQKNLLAKSLTNTADTREEIVKLQRDLTQERVRNSILSEDLNTPTNVHRWRLLHGLDADRFQLIEKVQMLQKQILKLQIDDKKKEDVLKKSHEDYLSLKVYIEKLPSYEIKTNLVKSQRVLRGKNKKMKALVSEITVLNMDIKARDCEIKKLEHSLLQYHKCKCSTIKCIANGEEQIEESLYSSREL